MTVRYVDHLLSGTTATYSIANRNASGSDGNGYKTITSGITAMSASDTLEIRAGTYTEALGYAPQFVSGTSGNPTIIRNRVGEDVTIIPASGNAAGDAISIYNSDYVTLKGDAPDHRLVVDGTNCSYYGIRVLGTSDHATIDGCEVRNTKYSGIDAKAPNASETTVFNDDNTFKNNYIHHVGTSAAGGHGIYIVSSRNIIENNIIDMTGHGATNNFGIQVYAHVVGGAANNVIRNNKISNALNFGIVIGSQASGPATGNQIYNNILISNTGGS